jgi:predicted polyphosphate/ATP-dependent NAD kinase
MRIGFVVNPIAGMGGRVGLKGTDDKLTEALDRGAEPKAPERARRALEAFANRAPDAEVLVAGGVMGEREAEAAGVDARVVTNAPDDVTETSAEDTRAAVRAFLDEGVDLILFVGGDGTAVDVAEALQDRDDDTPMLGVPAGVKVYSGVFGVSPEDAGRIAAGFDRVEQREVNDIDEDAFRGGEVHTELKAVVNVPVSDGELQASKQLSGGSVQTLAEGFAADADPEVTYVLGPGSTVGTVKRELGFEPSPLGVDVWRDGEVLVSDAAEADILEHLGERNVIVVSPIGGQGFIFGRGNDQISPDVIRQCEVQVVASRDKLDGVGVLRVDTDDEDLNEELGGWMKVRTGRFEHRLMKVE